MPQFAASAYAPRFVETMAAHVAKFGALDASKAVGWTLRLLKRIERLHGLGIAHGNISPKSVSGESADPRGRGVLTWTKPGENTPFRSPERGVDGMPSMADDVWCVALVSYVLVAGQNPFAAPDPAQAQRRASTIPLPQIRSTTPGIPELHVILAAALEKDPARRVRVIGELRAALEHWLGPSSIEMVPLEEEEDDAPTMVKPSDNASLQRLYAAAIAKNQPAAAPARAPAPPPSRPLAMTQPVPEEVAPPPSQAFPPIQPARVSQPNSAAMALGMPSQPSMPAMSGQPSMPAMSGQPSMPAMPPPVAMTMSGVFVDPVRERRITMIAVVTAVTIGLTAGVLVGLVGRLRRFSLSRALAL